MLVKRELNSAAQMWCWRLPTPTGVIVDAVQQIIIASLVRCLADQTQLYPNLCGLESIARENVRTLGQPLQCFSLPCAHSCVARAMPPNDQAQRPPPETPGRLQQSLTNCPNRPTAQRGGGSLQRIVRPLVCHRRVLVCRANPQCELPDVLPNGPEKGRQPTPKTREPCR